MAKNNISDANKVRYEMSKAVDAYEGVARAYNGGRTYITEVPNVSVRGDYNIGDYEYYRPGEATPQSHEGIIKACMKAYDRVPPVYNVINLMTDFTVKGIRIVHPKPSLNRFYNDYWKYANGFHVSERFCNYLYRIGTVPVKIKTAKVPIKTEKQWKSTTAEADVEIPKVEVETRTIPFEFSFLHPLSLEPIAPELGVFTGKQLYAFKPSISLQRIMQRLQIRDKLSEFEQEILNHIPKDIIESLAAGQKKIILDPAKFEIYFWKKDDWQPFGTPLAACILDSLNTLEKMHLADKSALDGAISNIRLWTIGYIDEANPANSLIPTREAIIKLRNILSNNNAGGVLDLVWGPELDFKESNTQVHNFLGPEKYEQVMSEIYEGLGVPPTLTGSGTGGGFTNNHIAIQTLINRLTYGRGKLIEFWNSQLLKVHQAMGFTSAPPQIVFDEISLADEVALKSLWISMLEHDVISEETFLEKCGMIPVVERQRILREYKERDKNKRPPKAGPYHNPEQEQDMKKLVLQGGGVAPSEVGVKLKPRKDGEKAPIDHEKEIREQELEQQKLKTEQQKVSLQSKKMASKKKQSGVNGRPKGAGDSTKRKQKRVTPRTKAGFIETMVWANTAQAEINNILLPAYLEQVGKKNQRALSSHEKNMFEHVKFAVLDSLEPFEQITSERVYDLMTKAQIKVSADTKAHLTALGMQFLSTHGREPSLDEIRQIQASAYALKHDEKVEDESISQGN
jgi:hypothetical protein